MCKSKGFRVTWSGFHVLAPPRPTCMALSNYLAILGIRFSKARKLWPTPHTMVPPLTHVPWIQSNFQTRDPTGPQPSLLRSYSGSGIRIKKNLTTGVWITFASTASRKNSANGDWGGKGSKRGTTFPSSTHNKCQNSCHARTAFYLEAKGSGLWMKKINWNGSLRRRENRPT